MTFRTLLILLLTLLTLPALAQETHDNTATFDSITLEGGPIWSHHFQQDDNNFREDHGLGILKLHTTGYGNWGLYILSPNSIDDTSVGFGYVTDPLQVPVGSLTLEFSGAVGLVTGYQDYPVPLLAAQARLILLQNQGWDAGLSMAALPYYIKKNNITYDDDDEFGIVATSPFFSLRYNFQ